MVRGGADPTERINMDAKETETIDVNIAMYGFLKLGMLYAIIENYAI